MVTLNRVAIKLANPLGSSSRVKPIICQLATGVRGDHQNKSRTASGPQFLYCLTCLIAEYEEAEHAKVSESVFECPPLLQSRTFAKGMCMYTCGFLNVTPLLCMLHYLMAIHEVG
ncbi:unnamed protein product [Toxocara canis]|uniref:Ovule protein n=1 Tax=Toxocara canis TaxID=6265 RepID=A0A183V6W2_TOXCA|nr:unnamed protein product [Toxocara canis]